MAWEGGRGSGASFLSRAWMGAVLPTARCPHQRARVQDGFPGIQSQAGLFPLPGKGRKPCQQSRTSDRHKPPFPAFLPRMGGESASLRARAWPAPGKHAMPMTRGLTRGFYTIMAAQFFSSLADNALFVAAVELLRTSGARHWQGAALVPMFALFYVLLAPWVGAFADSRPKGRVMFLSNAVKIIGCVLMLLGGHPLLAYAVVGLGAAAYSPAKYGILTELLPPSQLVKANGWIEGLTISSIVLGVVLGGQLVGPNVAPHLLALGVPGVVSAPQAAIAALILVYAAAAAFNLGIPRSGARLHPMPARKMSLLDDFWRCHVRLWNDRLGQISLATTTLFWGVSGNMRYIVLAWAAVALGYGTTEASNLIGVVAVGTAVGAVWASLQVRLERACNMLPLGVLMGVLLALMVFIRHLGIALPFLVVLGVLSGFIVVPMNALLQHRGHNLMGAGRSIAVQNFNEQACTLGLGALYSLLNGLGLHTLPTIGLLGVGVTVAMAAIMLWYRHNLRRYPDEIAHLHMLTRSDRRVHAPPPPGE